MPVSLTAILADALTLSPEDRVLLAEHLPASLSSSDPIEDAWTAEIERRLADVEAGGVTLIPPERAIERVRGVLRDHPPDPT